MHGMRIVISVFQEKVVVTEIENFMQEGLGDMADLALKYTLRIFDLVLEEIIEENERVYLFFRKMDDVFVPFRREVEP